MRFADLLGEPDDDGSAPGTPAPAVPGAPATGADPAPPGASGSLGGSGTADDELSRWFGPEDRAEPEPEPPARPTRAGAVAAATGAYEEPADEEPSDATQTPTGASAAVTADGSRTRDDLLPPRRSGRGRRGR